MGYGDKENVSLVTKTLVGLRVHVDGIYAIEEDVHLWAAARTGDTEENAWTPKVRRNSTKEDELLDQRIQMIPPEEATMLLKAIIKAANGIS